MPTIEQIVAQIRTALYGKDVRENIALGIETIYHEQMDDVVKTEDIANNLTTTASGKVLDARQGKVLDNSINSHFGRLGTSDLPIDDLNTIPLNYVGNAYLSAEISPISAKRSYSIIKYGYNSTRWSIVASDQASNKLYYCQNYLGTISNWEEIAYSGNFVNVSDIANNLTTTASGKVLDARQGKVLNDIVSSIPNDLIGFKENIPNMFENATWENGSYIDANGEVLNSTNMCYSSLIEITHPNDYLVIVKITQELHTFRIHGYDENGNWRRQLYSKNAADQELGKVYKTSIAANDCKYIRISLCKYYPIYMTQAVDDKDLTIKYQSDVNTYGLAQRKNLLDGVSWTEYAWLNGNAQVDKNHEEAHYGKCSDFIPVVTNKRYYLSVIQKPNRPQTNEIKIAGYDDNGNFVNWLRFVQPDEQTPGVVSVVSFWIRDNITQIRICMKNYVISCLSVSNDIDETVMESLYDESTMGWVVGGINWITGVENSNTERIRSVGWANLAADFIRGENIYFSLFIYDRDQSFKGIWNGHGLDYGKMTWFNFINMREVHNVLDRLYPNFIYKMTAYGPGTANMTVGFGTRVHFYVRKIPYASVGAYLNWAVIGASSDYGFFDGTTHPDYAWPKILARRVGNTVTNYSKGGRTLKLFINDTSSTGLAQLLADTAKELYVITLGGNDASGSDTIGSITDITNYSDWHNYPDTVYGNYGRILEQVMAHAPNAKFVLTTPPGLSYNERHLAVDNAVREISNHYQIPCIEWESDPFMNSNVYTKNQVGSHPTKIMYSGKALAFERLFSDCVAKNITYFS